MTSCGTGKYYILAPYSWGAHSHIDTPVTDATAVGQWSTVKATHKAQSMIKASQKYHSNTVNVWVASEEQCNLGVAMYVQSKVNY